MATSDELRGMLQIVKDHPAVTARRASDFAGIEPPKAQRLLRELEDRGLLMRWKRPGTRSRLWQMRETCAKCGTAACLEDKALDL